MFEEVFEKHADNDFSLKDDEYLKNGFKHCKVCNQARQCKVGVGEKQYVVKCFCKCQSEIIEHQQELKKQAEKLKVLKRGIIGAKYQNCFFENSDRDLPFAKEYVENFKQYYNDNIGLMIIGDKGTGKTFAASCIANELINRGVKVLMANITYLAETIAKFQNDKILDDLSTYPLVIIDDLGAERDSDYMREKVYQLVEMRAISNKPLIITSNISMTELKGSDTTPNFRVYDRLKGMCHPIVMNGKSRRVQQANERYARLNEKLKY